MPQKKVSIEKYSKALDKVIKRNKKTNIEDTLILLIEEASKYKII